MNLLPVERQRALSREYFLRLCVVVIAAMTTLVVIAGLLLVPTYVLLTQNAAAKQTSLAHIESVLSAADEKDISSRLAALSNDAAALAALGKTSSVSSVLRPLLAVEHPGVILSGFAYAPVTQNAPKTVLISGVAATRNALRSYQLALQKAPFVAAARLPVSAYAKDADIIFSITVTLAP